MRSTMTSSLPHYLSHTKFKKNKNINFYYKLWELYQIKIKINNGINLNPRLS